MKNATDLSTAQPSAAGFMGQDHKKRERQQTEKEKNIAYGGSEAEGNRKGRQNGLTSCRTGRSRTGSAEEGAP